MKIPSFAFGKKNSKSHFETYYKKEWLGRHSYFIDHKKRFVESWLFIENLPWRNSSVIDIGGIGPLSAYAQLMHGAQIMSTSHDLRSPSSMRDDIADIVLCTETIEHIKDVDSDNINDLEAFNFSGVNVLLSEISRISKPGASVFITTPNSSSIIQLMKWLKQQPLMMDSRHVREFTLPELEASCLKAGLRVERMLALNTWSSYSERQIEIINKFIKDMGGELGCREDNIFALLRNGKAK